MMRGMLICALGALAIGCAANPPRAEHPPRPATPDAEALFERGRSLATRGDALRGEQYMVMAVRLGYPEREAIVGIVGACLASSRLRAALAHAEPFLRRHPDAWEVRQLVGALHLALGDAQSAWTELERVVRQQPAAAEAHYLLAVIAQEHFVDGEAARERYLAYLERAPRGRHAAEARAWLSEAAR